MNRRHSRSLQFFILLLVFSVNEVSSAQTCGSSRASTQEDHGDLSQRYSTVFPNATIEIDPKTGIPMKLKGQVTVPGANSAREASDMLLHSLLGKLLSPAEWRVASERESLTGSTIMYELLYKDREGGLLPIFNATISVRLDRDNRVVSMDNQTQPINKSDTFDPPAPATEKSAIRVAKRYLSLQNPGIQVVGSPTARAGVLVVVGAPTAVWNINIKTSEPTADWQVFINAKSEEVIEARNLAVY